MINNNRSCPTEFQEFISSVQNSDYLQNTRNTYEVQLSYFQWGFAWNVTLKEKYNFLLNKLGKTNRIPDGQLW